MLIPSAWSGRAILSEVLQSVVTQATMIAPGDQGRVDDMLGKSHASRFRRVGSAAVLDGLPSLVKSVD